MGRSGGPVVVGPQRGRRAVTAIPSKAIWAYLLLGCAASIVAMAVGDGMAVGVYTFAAAQLPLVMWWSYRVYDVPKGMVLALTGVGLSFAAGAAIESIFGDTGTPLFISNLFALVGAIVITVGMSMLVRRRRGMNAAGVLGDALIVGLGSWLISWVAFLEPTLRLSDEPVLSSLVAGFYQPTGSVILFLMAVYLFTESTSNIASWLIGGTVLLMLVGDLLYALVTAGHVGDGILVLSTALYTMAYFTVAAAFMHRSITAIEHSQGTGDSQRLLGRLIITTSSLVFPVIVLAAPARKTPSDKIVRSHLGAACWPASSPCASCWRCGPTTRPRPSCCTARRPTRSPGCPTASVLLEQINDLLHESWRARISTRRCTSSTSTGSRTSTTRSATPPATRCCVIVAQRLVNAVPPEAHGRSPLGRRIRRARSHRQVAGRRHSRSPSGCSRVFREPLALSPGRRVRHRQHRRRRRSSATSSTSPEDVAPSRRHGDVPGEGRRPQLHGRLRRVDARARRPPPGRRDRAVPGARPSRAAAVPPADPRPRHRRRRRLRGADALAAGATARSSPPPSSSRSPRTPARSCRSVSWALLEALTQLRTLDRRRRVQPAGDDVGQRVAAPAQRHRTSPPIVSEALTRSGVSTPAALARGHRERDDRRARARPGDAAPAAFARRARRARRLRHRLLVAVAAAAASRCSGSRSTGPSCTASPTTRTTAALVRTIIAMGRSLGLDMVAEGVESVHQLQVLQRARLHARRRAT